MGIRLDHRARIPARAYQEMRGILQATNRLVTSFPGMASPFLIWGRLVHHDGFLVTDYVTNPGAPAGTNYTGRKRMALPKRTLAGMQRVAVTDRTSLLRWLARGGETSWGFGYDGVSTAATVDGDLLVLNSANPLAGYSSGHYVTDFFEGFAYPTFPTYASSLQVGGAGAPSWQSWSDPKSSLTITVPGGSSFPWGFSPANPSGIAWNIGYVEGEGRYESYPETMSSPPISAGNFILGGMDFEQTGIYGDAVSQVRINVTSQPLSLPVVLQALPQGSTVLEAKWRVRMTGWNCSFSEVESEWNPVLQQVVRSSTTSTALPDRSYSLISRRAVDGRWKFEALGVGLEVGALDRWAVVDVTDICQTILDTWRIGNGDELHLLPSGFASLLPGADLRGYLAGWLPTMEWEIFTGSGTQPSWAPEPVFVAGDQVIQRRASGLDSMSWSAIQTDVLVVRFRWPNGELGVAEIPGNLPRMDLVG